MDRAALPFVAVIALVITPLIGVGAISLHYLFGVIVPYVAALIFFAGFIMKVVNWGTSPVPFRIPTTCGQQKSLPWFKHSKLENPVTGIQVIGRMFLEVVFFRSLFRNLKPEIRGGPRIVYGPTKWLWFFALMFHWCFFIIFFRHLRLFTEPVPGVVTFVDRIDSMFQICIPPIYLTDLGLLLGITCLFLRRVIVPQVRYLSLPSDYFPLFLIIGIAVTGMLMRYVIRVDIIKVKELALSLAAFSPKVPQGIGVIFYTHLFLVCVLAMYFPFSKLMHLGGVFMSPTRNLANNNRIVRHINPWNPKVKLHPYEEWEDEFRDKLLDAGIPVEKKG